MATKKDVKVCEKPCLIKGCIIPTIAVFALISVFQYLFHGVVMMPHYEATADLWRDAAGMEELRDFSLIIILLISVVLVKLYCCHTSDKACMGKCPSTGAKFGLTVGLLLGLWDLQSYAWLPLTDMSIPLAWLFGNTVMGLLVGLLLCWLKSCLCKDK